MDELQPQIGMSNPCSSGWKLTEQIMILVWINLEQLTQYSNIKSMTQQQETRIEAKPVYRTHLPL